ncbi:MAG: hypothetical protein KatS3mg102_0264 [Planctomycetota bacterium]|nr:MAG: hypothetical protein KatS3mg102_0264 [Planctomycetota bacterium]
MLEGQRVFAATVAVGADRPLLQAAAQNADVLLRLRLQRAEVRFAGLNQPLYALNWGVWFMFWIPSWWVADERYALAMEGELELLGVRSERVLWRQRLAVEVERSLDDFDRGLVFPGLPYLPGWLDEDNLRLAGQVLAPYATNQLLLEVLRALDGPVRAQCERGELVQRDASLLALLVGVSRHRSYRLHNLRFAAADARALRMALLDPARTSPIPAKNVTLLTDEEATAEGVRAALAQLLARTRPVDRVLIYFAGYATPSLARPGDALLVPHDYEPGAEEQGLSLRDLVEQLAAAEHAGALLVLDAGLQGGAEGRALAPAPPGDSALGAPLANSLVQAAGEALTRAGGRVALATASGPGGGAYESAELRHGLFTFHLVRGLRGEDAPGQAPRAWPEALAFALAETAKHAALEAVPQRPELAGDLEAFATGGRPAAGAGEAAAPPAPAPPAAGSGQAAEEP